MPISLSDDEMLAVMAAHGAPCRGQVGLKEERPSSSLIVLELCQQDLEMDK